MTAEQPLTGRDPELVDQAALIWAEAAAKRDGDDEVPTLEEARPGILAVLDTSPDAFLVVLREDEVALGFTAVERCGESEAELRYLGVSPGAWGRGVAGRLLAELVTQARARSLRRLGLMVYLDNDGAVQLYERHGRKPDREPSVHPRSGRIEQHYTLDL